VGRVAGYRIVTALVPEKVYVGNRTAKSDTISVPMAEAELTMHDLRRIILIKAFVLIFPVLLGLFMSASWIGVGQKKGS
jgi:hypothetical protein